MPNLHFLESLFADYAFAASGTCPWEQAR